MQVLNGRCRIRNAVTPSLDVSSNEHGCRPYHYTLHGAMPPLPPNTALSQNKPVVGPERNAVLLLTRRHFVQFLSSSLKPCLHFFECVHYAILLWVLIGG